MSVGPTRAFGGVRGPVYGRPMAPFRPSPLVEHLRGVRLGGYERYLLREAPHPSGSTPLPIDATDWSEPIPGSLRRAASKLERVGLLESERRPEHARAREPRREETPLYRQGAFWEWPDKTRRHIIYRRVVWLTALGWGVNRCCRHEIATGLPIRWTNDLLARIHRYGFMYVDRRERAEVSEQIRHSVLDFGDDPVEPREEVAPPGVVSEADRERWRCAVDRAVRDHPSAGAARLWAEACALFESSEDLPPVRAKHGSSEVERFLATHHPLTDAEKPEYSDAYTMYSPLAKREITVGRNREPAP